MDREARLESGLDHSWPKVPLARPSTNLYSQDLCDLGLISGETCIMISKHPKSFQSVSGVVASYAVVP